MADKYTYVTVEIPVTVRMGLHMKVDEDGDWETTSILDTDYLSDIDGAIEDNPEALAEVEKAVEKVLNENK